MKLVIAEKPSVAMSLAAVLGANEKKDGYLEGGGYLVSWCVGHLLELAQPEAYGEQYARWRYGDLPILPETWKYEVPKDKKKQLDLLCRLMKDKRVESVVCATDAGREGELIFRLVYEHAGCKKPMERLWISSMEDAAIRDGFEHLRPGSDYDKLYDAAVCRAGADWLIGINATRLFSVLYGVTLNVGRVMSPTLALLVQREADIQAFASKPFYVPEITCGGFTASGEKLSGKNEAEKIRRDCDGQAASVRSVEKQVKTVQPPRLYDLTTLQRECNRIYGYRLPLLYAAKMVDRLFLPILPGGGAAGGPGARICHYRRGHFPETENMPGLWESLSAYYQPGVLFGFLPHLCQTEIRAGTQAPDQEKLRAICPQLNQNEA